MVTLEMVSLADSEDEMKAVVDEKYAYIDIGNGDLVCIGTKEEAHKASVEQLAEMITHAIAIAYYNTIESGKRRVLH